jgi:hypothetical protein
LAPSVWTGAVQAHSKRSQREAIANVVVGAVRISTSSIIVDLNAVADIHETLRREPPNRVLQKPGKVCREF